MSLNQVGNMIIDIGGGTTEVAVISLGGIVVSNSLRIAGDELDEDIIEYIKKNENLAIGEKTAENIKTTIGCAMPLMADMPMEVRGRDLNSGLPRNITITSTQTTSDSNVLGNFTITQGVNNSYTTKTISHNTVNDTFRTVY